MFLKKLHAQSSVTDDTVHLWVADEMTGVLFCMFLCFSVLFGVRLVFLWLW